MKSSHKDILFGRSNRRQTLGPLMRGIVTVSLASDMAVPLTINGYGLDSLLEKGTNQ